MGHRKPVAAVNTINAATRTALIYLYADSELQNGMQLFASPFKVEGIFTYKDINVYGDVDSIRKLAELLEQLSIKNGDPAFGEFKQVDDCAIRDGDITVIDYFAAEVSPEILRTSKTFDDAADDCFKFAAAMMRARKKVRP